MGAQSSSFFDRSLGWIELSAGARATSRGARRAGKLSLNLSRRASAFASASGPGPTPGLGSGKRFLPTPGVSGVGWVGH